MFIDHGQTSAVGQFFTNPVLKALYHTLIHVLSQISLGYTIKKCCLQGKMKLFCGSPWLSMTQCRSLIILGRNVFLMKWNRADWSVLDSSSTKVQPIDGYINKFHALMSHTFDSFPSRPEGKVSLCLFLFDWWFLLSLRHLSSVLGNKFDHGAESIMPTLLNLVPNSAKIMATSGMAAIRLILRVSSDDFLFHMYLYIKSPFWHNNSVCFLYSQLPSKPAS